MMTGNQMPHAHPVFAEDKTTVFEVFSALARETGAINLGQGFPDHGEPPDIIAAAADALHNRSNQYPPLMGLPELREAIAAHEKRFYNLDVDAGSEVMVALGATEALAAAILAYVRPGDEVVTFEPMYDSYAPIVKRAGATIVPVRLSGPDWGVDRAALEAAFNARTRVVILNNPMNPTGKLYAAEELGAIAELCQRHDAIAICDEVYEHIVFDGKRFTPLIALPGMRERTVRIGSAGKTFSLTGWKVGYAVAASEILGPIARCHQFLTFTIPPALQYGVAHGLGLSDSFFEELSGRMARKRDLLTAALRDVGLTVNACDGTYFLIADISDVAGGENDFAFAQRLTREAGVVAIPVSAFYEKNPPHDMVRFCFCKKDDVMHEGAKRLAAYFGGGATASHGGVS